MCRVYVRNIIRALSRRQGRIGAEEGGGGRLEGGGWGGGGAPPYIFSILMRP